MKTAQAYSHAHAIRRAIADYRVLRAASAGYATAYLTIDIGSALAAKATPPVLYTYLLTIGYTPLGAIDSLQRRFPNTDVLSALEFAGV